MCERMLMTQALNKRALLIKKITAKLAKASFVDTMKPDKEKVYAGKCSKEEYTKKAQSSYQQITDLISRFQKIDAAITDSNARTKITISCGTITVAEAISLRRRLQGGSCEDKTDFEGMLQRKMKTEYDERIQFCKKKNRRMRPKAELVDPLKVQKRIAMLEEKRMKLLKELDAQIRISNAATYIEIL